MKQFIEKMTRLSPAKLIFSVSYALVISLACISSGAFLKEVILNNVNLSLFWVVVGTGISWFVQYILPLLIIKESVGNVYHLSCEYLKQIKIIMKTPLFWRIQRFNGLVSIIEGLKLGCKCLLIFLGCQFIYSLEYDLYSVTKAIQPYDILGLYVGVMMTFIIVKGMYRIGREYYANNHTSLIVKEIIHMGGKVIAFELSKGIINNQGYPYLLETIVETGFWVMVCYVGVNYIKKWVHKQFVYKRAPYLNTSTYHLVYSSSASHFLNHFTNHITIEETELLPVEILHLSATEQSVIEHYQSITEPFESDAEIIASGIYEIELTLIYPYLWTMVSIVFQVHKYAPDESETTVPSWINRFKRKKETYYIENRPFEEVHENAAIAHAQIFGSLQADQGSGWSEQEMKELVVKMEDE